MKFIYQVNQLSAMIISEETDANLNSVDLDLYSFIVEFCNSKYSVKIPDEAGDWVWISYELILQQMPLLRIKSKTGLMPHINRLIKAKLLEKNPNNDKLRKSYYRLGENYDRYLYSNPEEMNPTNFNKDNPAKSDRDTAIPTKFNKDIPTKSNRDTLLNLIGNKYNNINKKNNDNNIYAEKQNFSERETPQSENPFVSFLNTEETKSVINLNSVNNNQTPPPDIAPAPRPVEKKKETVFDDCELADYNKFMAKFSSEEYQKLDMNYYYHAVKNWSEMNSKIKRTERGWAATVRTFILNDKNKKSLKLKEQEKPFDFEAARRYLNNEF